MVHRRKKMIPMKEEFLHYLWKHKALTISELKTTSNKKLEILHPGIHNLNAGPDFFNGKIRINGLVWAGNIEIHVRSSDWYSHRHHLDSNYDNVILHVVWKENKEVYTNKEEKLETLELYNIAPIDIVSRYNELLFRRQNWINCEKQINEIKVSILKHWLGVLYFERLEIKSKEIESMIDETKSDWESILFRLLVKNFGLNINSTSFLNLANSIDYRIIRMQKGNLMNLEALLFGQAGLLNRKTQITYHSELRKQYHYLQIKYNIKPIFYGQFNFFRLRPSSFPTIRIAQLSKLFSSHDLLLSRIMKANRLRDYYDVFQVGTSKYWEYHYSFNSKSYLCIKSLSKAFIDLILINCIIPFKLAYYRNYGFKDDSNLMDLIYQIKPEKNGIIEKFRFLLDKRSKEVILSSFQTQGLIQLKNQYCDKNKCLSCTIGHYILKKEKTSARIIK